ncbi:MAG: hypothetical protein P8I92_01895 [Schleiferiaceae bacterium]|nr:hypothetical protein [Schleiferiaceae bacterium]
MKRGVILFLLLAVLSNCSNEYVGIDALDIAIGPDINFPIGTVDMTLGNVVGNLGMETQSDSTGIYLETRLDSVATIYADSLFPEIPVASIADSFAMGTVQLPQFQLQNGMSLSQFGNAAGGTIAAMVNSLNGTTQPFPPLGPASGGTYPTLGTSPVCEALLTSGSTSLQITNNWPVPVSLNVVLYDVTNGAVVTSFQFTNVPSGSTQSQTKSLVGKTISGNLIFDIVSVNTPGSSGASVYINTSEEIIMNMSMSGLEAESGSVYFPTSELSTSADYMTFPMPLGVQLSKILVESANLVYKITSPLQTVVTTDLTMPNSNDGFGEYSIQINSGPLLPDTGTIVMTNVELDLTSNPNSSYNSLGYIVHSFLADISNCIEFDQSENLTFEFSIQDMKIKGIEGYLGQFSFQDSSSIDIDSIGDLSFDYLSFYEPEVDFEITNGLGIPLFFSLDLESQNQFGKFSQNVSNFPISYPTEYIYPLERISVMEIRPSASDPFISLPNNSLKFEFGADIVSTFQQNAFENFIYKGEDLNANVILRQKTNIALSNLVISDTIDLGGPLDTSGFYRLDSLFLTISYSNNLGMEMETTLDFIDSADSIVMTKPMALLDGIGESKIGLSKTEIGELSKVSKILIGLKLSTVGLPESVTLFPESSILMNLSLGGKLKVKII